MRTSKLNPCPKCGGNVKMNISFGGSIAYYGVYCQNNKCGHNNRTHNSAMFGYGLGEAGGFPPQNENVAIDEWNKQKEKKNETR